MTRPGLPRQTDAELHVYRAAELGHALRAGAGYARWAPSLFLGYGYPIFNYYAPLTYYLANLFDLVPGLGIVGAVKGVFVLGFLLAAVGSYELGRELFGRAAGVLAAASFTFAPYVVLIDAHARGDLAEHFALCLLPVVFFFFRRLMSGVGGRGAFLGTIVSLAALVLSHNLMGVVAAVLLLAYWVWEIAFDSGRPRAATGLLAFVLAAMVCAFFWLPALLEWDKVELAVIGPGHFDFRTHFVSVGEVLAPSPILDMGAAAPAYRFNLGLAQWLLALPVLVAIRRDDVRRKALYYAIAGFCLVGLMLAGSVDVWESIPGMAYLQFPWRLLGPANLMLAICAAAGSTVLPRARWRDPALAIGLAAVLVLSLPALYPPMWEREFGGTTPEEIIAWEVDTGALGTTSTRDFVPKGAALVPMHPTETLLASFTGSDQVDKVNRATLPEGSRVEILEHGPLHDRLAVVSPKPFVLRLYTFFFPGWRAYVDGVETEIEIAYPEGFITVRLPEGEHEVLVRFQDTPPRIAGWVVTAIGCVALIVVVGAPSKLWSAQSPAELPPLQAGRGDGLSTFAWMGGAILCFALVKIVLVDPQDGWLRYTSPPGEAWAAAENATAVFANQIELLGYDLPRREVRAGELASVTLYWRAITAPSGDYQSFVHLARPLHLLWGQEDHLNPGELPTTRWPLDRYVRDEYEFTVLPGTPPGEYTLNIGLYSMTDGYRLPLVDPEGNPTGDSFALASIEVLRPRGQPGPEALAMLRALDVVFPTAGVTLMGFDQPYAEITTAQAWPITLYWRADQDQPAIASRDLVFLDEIGDEAARFAGFPGVHSAADWQAGDAVRDPIVLTPNDVGQLAPGVYRFGVQLMDDRQVHATHAGEPLVMIGELHVRADRASDE